MNETRLDLSVFHSFFLVGWRMSYAELCCFGKLLWPWFLVLQILENGEQIGLKHFRPIKPLGSGDTGRFLFFLFSSLVLFSIFLIISQLLELVTWHTTELLLQRLIYYYILLAFSVHLVELEGTGQHFAMKAMDKGVMLNRNKVLNLIIYNFIKYNLPIQPFNHITLCR